jgi:AhpD family alkylhydroperoxidase
VAPPAGVGTTPLRHVEWEDCFLEPVHSPELEDGAKQAFGYIPTYIRYLASCPWVVRSLFVFNPVGIGLVHTSFDLAEFVALVVSQDNSCRFCYAAHRSYLKILGFPEDRIQSLEHDILTGQLGKDVRLPLEFVRRVSRCDPAPGREERQALLATGYTEGALKELTFIAALYVYANRIATLPAIPYEGMESFERRWIIRLLRPFIARRFTRRRRRGAPASLPAERRTGPYSYAVCLLDGLPIAGVLRDVLDDACGPSSLPPRTKALVFAVVARALECAALEREALQLLAAEGLDASEVQSVLAHLGSPVLDPIETVIVPYARETVRYDPVQIQRRGRELCEQLSPGQFVDLVGTAALANMVARISVSLNGQG